MAQVADYPGGASPTSRPGPRSTAGGIGVFGSGGTGGGNAIYGGRPRRARPGDVVAQVPVADGRDWLHRMRREHEWLEFLDSRPGGPRAACARPASRSMVAPRDGIMVPTPERTTTTVKSDVDDRVPEQVAAPSRGGDLRLPAHRRRGPHRAPRADAHRGRARRGHPGGPQHAMYERAAGPQAAGRPDRHHPLRGVRPVPGDREPAASSSGSDRYLVDGEVVVHEDAAETGITLPRPGRRLAGQPTGGAA